MLQQAAYRLWVESMKATQFDDDIDAKREVQFVIANGLTRPWLVHASVRSVCASIHGYSYDSGSSPAPRYASPTLSSGLLTQFAG